jgi:DNA-binding PadR family transcriptional regulator
MHAKSTSNPSDQAIAENSIENASRPLQYFEHAVLHLVSVLGENAYPANITRSLMKKFERNISLAQVFVALERLEDKGFVSSRTEMPTLPTRGGRRRRVFIIETSGRWAMSKTAAAFGVSSRGETSDASKGQKVPSPA